MTVLGALSSFFELGGDESSQTGMGKGIRCYLELWRHADFWLPIDFRLPRRNSAMGQGLGLAAVSEARASACVSTYSRTFVNLPF
jgi:hypothetical protein